MPLTAVLLLLCTAADATEGPSREDPAAAVARVAARTPRIVRLEAPARQDGWRWRASPTASWDVAALDALIENLEDEEALYGGEIPVPLHLSEGTHVLGLPASALPAFEDLVRKLLVVEGRAQLHDAQGERLDGEERWLHVAPRRRGAVAVDLSEPPEVQVLAPGATGAWTVAADARLAWTVVGPSVGAELVLVRSDQERAPVVEATWNTLVGRLAAAPAFDGRVVERALAGPETAALLEEVARRLWLAEGRPEGSILLYRAIDAQERLREAVEVLEVAARLLGAEGADGHLLEAARAQLPTLRLAATGAETTWQVEGPDGSSEIVVPVDGEVHLEALEPGRYRVVATPPPGTVGGVDREVRLGRGARETVEAAFVRPPPVTVRLPDFVEGWQVELGEERVRPGQQLEVPSEGTRLRIRAGLGVPVYEEVLPPLEPDRTLHLPALVALDAGPHTVDFAQAGEASWQTVPGRAWAEVPDAGRLVVTARSREVGTRQVDLAIASGQAHAFTLDTTTFPAAPLLADVQRARRRTGTAAMAASALGLGTVIVALGADGAWRDARRATRAASAAEIDEAELFHDWLDRAEEAKARGRRLTRLAIAGTSLTAVVSATWVWPTVRAERRAWTRYRRALEARPLETP